MRQWRRLMTVLGLTRVGRILFTVTAMGGVLLGIADDVIPRSGSEADLGPNIAAVVIVFTIGLLALVAAADGLARLVLRGLRQTARLLR